MKKINLLEKLPTMKRMAIGCMLLGIGCFPMKAQQECEAPTGLKAETNGYAITLSWDLAPRGGVLLKEGFEGTTFLPEGWAADTLNVADPSTTWFQFPTPFFEGGEELVYDGKKTAAIYMDVFTEFDEETDPTISANQDERLITKEVEGVVYLDFYSWIDAHVLEYGAEEEFPDHYYVEVSHDNGQTWTPVWDARYDSHGTSDWELTSLRVGAPGQKTRIAFHAVSGKEYPEDALYFMWMIDDVCFSDGITTDEGKNRTAVIQQMKQKERPQIDQSRLKTYRPFLSKSGKKATPQSKAPAAVDSYNVYRNGNLIKEHLLNNSFTDLEEKQPGDYVYTVKAYCADCQAESEPTEINVHIDEFTLNPPTHVRATAEPHEDGGYEIMIYWDAPEGKRVPLGYNCFINGSMIAGEVPIDEEGVGQYGWGEGLYICSVTAIYEYPEGESERVSVDVATTNTRYPARNVSAVLSDNNSVAISWEAPSQTGKFTLKGYNVYCGDKQIANNLTGTSYTYENAPAGIYDYTVKVLYTDDVESAGRAYTLTNGEIPVYDLGPGDLFEGFDKMLKPGNWQVTNEVGDDLAEAWKFRDIAETHVNPNSIMKKGIVYLDSEIAGPWCNGQKSALVTPPVEYNANTEVILHLNFDYDYFTKENSKLTLEVSPDKGATWELLETLEGHEATYDDDHNITYDSTPKHVCLDVDKYFRDNKVAMFRWVYEGYYDLYAAIDNVNIGTTIIKDIESITSDRNIQVYTDKAHNLTVQTAGQEVRSITVMSVSGAKLLEAKGTATLSAASLDNGIYLVRITTDEGSLSKKVILK